MREGEPLGWRGGGVVLAVDTSSDRMCCALGRLSAEGPRVEVLACADRDCRRRSNVELVGACRDVVAAAGLSMGDVDAVLCGRGPGSFTGVRIGIATAKGLACGLGVPLLGASTLDAVAWTAWLAGARGRVGVVADAMRGEVYPGIYDLGEDGPRRAFASETVAKAGACADAWAARADAAELRLAGDGLRRHADRFAEAGLSRLLDEAAWVPSGEGLLRALAHGTDGTAGGTGDPALVLPTYTRLSDAEENERRRLGMPQPASVAVTGTADLLADRHLQLRPMSVNDLDQVAALEARVWEAGPHAAWSERAFLDDVSLPGHCWWVAHDEGRVVGFAGGRMAGDDFEVLDVVVAPERRREGVASRLVARIAYDAQMLNARTCSLEVDAADDAARALYRSLGLREAGRRRDYYGPGADAVVMVAELPLALDAARVGGRPEPQASALPWPPARAPRDADAAARLEAAGDLVLAIESSCDETACAVIGGSGEVLSSVVATQIDFHARFGGVVPEIASRKHVEAIVGTYEEAMLRAGERLGCGALEPGDLSAVGVTAGPGLVGALVVGVAFAKGLCAACDLPLVPVHHLEAHLMANLFETPDLEPPFVASLVSGGNTMLVHVRGWGDYRVLGATIDDAVGEAFDKVAKALGLGYPGGPVISRLSAQGDPKAIRFPRAMLHSGDYSFSLSGLKTAVITYIEGENRAGRPIDLPDLAASFEAAVVDVQVAKAAAAVDECGVADFCAGGGVAANPRLRAAYERELGRRGVRVTVPPLRACGDNAAMVAVAALRGLRSGAFAPLDLDADPNAALGTWATPDAPVPPTWE